MKLDQLIERAKLKKASDIHITANNFVYFRIHGILLKQEIFLSTEIVSEYFSLLIQGSGSLRETFYTHGSIDLGYSIEEQRFRINLYNARGVMNIAIRILNHNPATYDELNIPSHIRAVSGLSEGLVLITGITGSGKTTTGSSIISDINDKYNKHIITLEDPIEYVYKSNESKISQRQLGDDVKSFSYGLRDALREDPDVIYVGEMRDQTSMSFSLEAAETGHLVLSTLHAQGTVRSIQRLIDAFPLDHRHTMAQRMAGSLRAIISQSLLIAKDGSRRYLVTEFLQGTPEVQNLIYNMEFDELDRRLTLGKVGVPFIEDYNKVKDFVIPTNYFLDLEEKRNLARFNSIAKM